MVKTKVVRKNDNWRRLEDKCWDTGQDFAGSSKWEFFGHIYILFHFLMQKDWQ